MGSCAFDPSHVITNSDLDCFGFLALLEKILPEGFENGINDEDDGIVLDDINVNARLLPLHHHTKFNSTNANFLSLCLQNVLVGSGVF